MSNRPDFSIAFNNPRLSDRLMVFVSTHQGKKRKADEASLDDDERASKDAKVESTSSSSSSSSSSSAMAMDLTELHVSSSILSGYSPMFAKMFTSEFKESKDKEFIIQVDNDEERQLHVVMMSFLYNDKLPDLTPHQLLHLLILADKYEISALSAACLAKLTSTAFSPEFAIELLQLKSLPAVCNELVETAKNVVIAKCSKDTLILFGLPLEVTKMVVER